MLERVPLRVRQVIAWVAFVVALTAISSWFDGSAITVDRVAVVAVTCLAVTGLFAVSDRLWRRYAGDDDLR